VSAGLTEADIEWGQVDDHWRDFMQFQITRARQLFLACAQSSCPNLIQGDCARFGDAVAKG
jgi:phytoene/squalene synthetase